MTSKKTFTPQELQYLKLLAKQKIASKNHSKNLAGLKKFAEGNSFDKEIKQQELQSSLDKLAQVARSMHEYDG